MNKNSNFVWLIVIVLIIISLIYWVVNRNDNVVVNPTPTPTASVSPITPILSRTATSTIIGEYVCLPHRDTTGPTTMECAFGIELDNGTYYALDTSMMGTTTIDLIPTGNRIRVEGRLGTTTDQQMSIYNIEGLIKVGSIEQI